MKRIVIAALCCSILMGCSYDSLNDERKPNCMDGQIRCSAEKTSLEKCQDEQFLKERDCKNDGMICGTNADGVPGCVFEKTMETCDQEGTDMCSNDRLYRCLNGYWTLKENCVLYSEACFKNSTNDAFECGTCEQGAYDCVNSKVENGRVRVCVNGRFEEIETCEDHSVCVLNETGSKPQAFCGCEAGQSYCSGDNKLMTCDENTHEWVESECSGDKPKCVSDQDGSDKASCMPDGSVCADGATKCGGEPGAEVLIVCENGQWKEKPCEGAKPLCEKIADDQPAACVKAQCDKDHCTDELNGFHCDNGRRRYLNCSNSESCTIKDGEAQCLKTTDNGKKCIKEGQYCDPDDGIIKECAEDKLQVVDDCQNKGCDPKTNQCKSEDTTESPVENPSSQAEDDCDGQFKCVVDEETGSSAVYACENGKITDDVSHNCYAGCDASDSTKCAACPDAQATRCDVLDSGKGQIISCNNENGAVDDSQKCEFGCAKDNKTCNECKSGTTKCRDNGMISTCKDGKWEEATACSSDGSQYCSKDGDACVSRYSCLDNDRNSIQDNMTKEKLSNICTTCNKNNCIKSIDIKKDDEYTVGNYYCDNNLVYKVNKVKGKTVDLLFVKPCFGCQLDNNNGYFCSESEEGATPTDEQ